MALKQLFFQKVTKTREAVGDFAPKPPSVTLFSYTKLLTHVSQFSRFGFLNLGLSPFPSAKFCLSANTQATATNLPFYDISVSQKVPLSKIFDDVIACDLWLGPLPIKNSGYAYADLTRSRLVLEMVSFRTNNI